MQVFSQFIGMLFVLTKQKFFFVILNWSTEIFKRKGCDFMKTKLWICSNVIIHFKTKKCSEIKSLSIFSSSLYELSQRYKKKLLSLSSLQSDKWKTDEKLPWILTTGTLFAVIRWLNFMIEEWLSASRSIITGISHLISSVFCSRCKSPEMIEWQFKKKKKLNVFSLFILSLNWM